MQEIHANSSNNINRRVIELRMDAHHEMRERAFVLVITSLRNSVDGVCLRFPDVRPGNAVVLER